LKEILKIKVLRGFRKFRWFRRFRRLVGNRLKVVKYRLKELKEFFKGILAEKKYKLSHGGNIKSYLLPLQYYTP